MMEFAFESAAREIAEMAVRYGAASNADTLQTILINNALNAQQMAKQRYRGKDVAARVYKFDRQVGRSFDGMNGDLVYAIVRHGIVVTLMLKRSSQPVNTGVFSVDKIMIVE